MFISKEAHKNKTSAVLTFDQPLWWKARLIIEQEPDTSPVKKMVLMLGGFHMKMSYLGCIGYLMTGSGLQETLEQVYAPNSVLKMLNGKAIARSIRGQAMHPFFAASGHNNYTKSVQVYLQDMQQLHQTNPDVLNFFSDGNFVTRRTNRY